MKQAIARVMPIARTVVPCALMLLTNMEAMAAPKAEMCPPGMKMNPHTVDGLNFATTSWVRQEKNAHIYRTCVENRASKGEAWIDWRIPGPRTYIAPQDSAVSERPFWDWKPANLATCLFYGAYRKPMKELYLAHEDDRPRADAEGDCSKVPTAPTMVALKSSEFFSGELEGRAAIPSDIEQVERTLIRFVYKVALRETSSGYNIAFTYQAGGVSPEFNGDVRQISINPSSVIQGLAADKLEPIRLQSLENTITIAMKMPRPFTLSTSSLFFLDRAGRPATVISVPVLLPAQ